MHRAFSWRIYRKMRRKRGREGGFARRQPGEQGANERGREEGEERGREKVFIPRRRLQRGQILKRLLAIPRARIIPFEKWTCMRNRRRIREPRIMLELPSWQLNRDSCFLR